MSKKTLSSCRSGHDVIQYAKKHPGTTVVWGKGSHMKIQTAKGTTVCPDHRTDLGTGLRKALFKQLAAIGITILVLGALVLHYAA